MLTDSHFYTVASVNYSHFYTVATVNFLRPNVPPLYKRSFNEPIQDELAEKEGWSLMTFRCGRSDFHDFTVMGVYN